MKIWLFIVILLVVLSIGLLVTKLNTSHTKIVDSNLGDSTNLSSCENILNSTSREQCYLYLARNSKDPEICRKIIDVKLRGDCYLIVDTNK